MTKLAYGDNHIGSVSLDGGVSAVATFTPAAASHVAGDVHGGAQEFDLAAPSGGRIKINSISLQINGATIETTAWTLHMFSVTPVSALADDAAFILPATDQANYLGSIAITQVVDYGDTLWQQVDNLNKQIKLAGTKVWGYLTNGTTLTPQAVAHKVTIHGELV